MSMSTSVNETLHFFQSLGGGSDSCEQFLSLTISEQILNYYTATFTTYAIDDEYDGNPETPPLVRWKLAGLGGFGVEDKITFHSDWIYYLVNPYAGTDYVDAEGYDYSAISDSATMEVTKLEEGVIAIHFHDNQFLPDYLPFYIPVPPSGAIPIGGEHISSVITAILTKVEI